MSLPANPPYIPRMTVRVLLFAAYADALGRDAVELSLPPGATAADALAAVRALP